MKDTCTKKHSSIRKEGCVKKVKGHKKAKPSFNHAQWGTSVLDLLTKQPKSETEMSHAFGELGL